MYYILIKNSKISKESKKLDVIFLKSGSKILGCGAQVFLIFLYISVIPKLSNVCYLQNQKNRKEW